MPGRSDASDAVYARPTDAGSPAATEASATTPARRTASVEGMHLLHSADLSPDGSLVAWAMSRIVGDSEQRTLYLSRVGAPVTDAVEVSVSGRAYTPAFSPDGSRLAFLCDHGGSVRIGVIRVDDAPNFSCEELIDPREPERAVTGRPAWSPDGSRIAYAAIFSARRPDMPYRITRSIGWVDGLDLVDDVTSDIYVYDVTTGMHVRLTDDEWVNSQPTWLMSGSGGNPGADTAGSAGTRIVFRAGCGPDDWRHGAAAIRSVSADGSGDLTEHARSLDIFGLARTADATIAVSSLGAKPHTRGRVFIADTSATADNADTSATADTPVGRPGDWPLTDRTDGLDIDVNGDVLGDVAIPFVDPYPLLLVRGQHAFVRVQVQNRLEVHRLSLHGPPRADVVLSGPGCFYPLAVTDDVLLYATGTLTTAPDLWARDLSTGVDAQITDTATHNRACSPESTAVEFWVRADNGRDVQAMSLRPAGATGPLPTVLLIHGGPRSAYGQVYVTDAQLLCEAGFGVIMVNPHGSRGYGMEFADAIIGAWGQQDYRDLMAAMDFAVRQEWADPDRLGVSGLSYGGYMSSWIIGHSTRFKAAVIENPVTNFWSFYGTSDAGLSFAPDVVGVQPQDDFGPYRELSPITAAHTCTTPTLLIQGERDHRCPPEQSKQLYSVLRRAGCVAELLMLPGASHEGSISGAVVVRRAQNEALVDWMLRYVRG